MSGNSFIILNIKDSVCKNKISPKVILSLKDKTFKNHNTNMITAINTAYKNIIKTSILPL